MGGLSSVDPELLRKFNNPNLDDTWSLKDIDWFQDGIKQQVNDLLKSRFVFDADGKIIDNKLVEENEKRESAEIISDIRAKINQIGIDVLQVKISDFYNLEDLLSQLESGGSFKSVGIIHLNLS